MQIDAAKSSEQPVDCREAFDAWNNLPKSEVHLNHNRWIAWQAAWGISGRMTANSLNKIHNAPKRESISLDYYDAGLLGDGGGGDVNWWQDYIRQELARAHDFYQHLVDQHE